MTSIKEVLDFCNEFTSYDHYQIDRVIELNYIRDYIIIILAEIDFKHEGNRIRALGIIVDISLKVIYGDVENIECEKANGELLS